MEAQNTYGPKINKQKPAVIFAYPVHATELFSALIFITKIASRNNKKNTKMPSI
jgi:hypothetical protein